MHIEVDGQVVFDVPGQAGRSDLWSCTIAEIPGAEVDPLLTPRRLDRAQAADSVWERARRWRGHECLEGSPEWQGVNVVVLAPDQGRSLLLGVGLLVPTIEVS